MIIKYFVNAMDLVSNSIFLEDLKKLEDKEESAYNEIENPQTSVGRKIYLLGTREITKFNIRNLDNFMVKRSVKLQDIEFITALYGTYEEEHNYIMNLITLKENFKKDCKLEVFGHILRKCWFEVPIDIARLISDTGLVLGFDRDKNIYSYDNHLKDNVFVEQNGDINVYLQSEHV